VNGLFESLARAQSAEEVVRVLFMRADGLREAPSEVRAPVQAVIQEIQQEVARTVATSTPVAAPAEATRPSRLARPETRSLGEAPVRSRPSTTTKPTAAYRGAVTVRSGDDRVMKLVRKLQDLIHLAETQNRLADAQRQVRMAEDTASARAEAGHGASGNPNSPDKDSQVDVEALVREVSASIGRELQNRRERRTEDPDESVWW
jgi:hypothetical protein